MMKLLRERLSLGLVLLLLYTGVSTSTVLFEAVLFLSSNSGVTTKINEADRWAQNYFNVREYGALCDNSHNDLPNIQAATNAAIAAGGGIVRFPAGTCIVNGPIDFSSNSQFSIKFQGVGINSHIKGNGDFFIFDRSVEVTGSISTAAGGTLTVTAVKIGVIDPTGSRAVAGLNGAVASGTLITGQLTGTPGGIGTYSVNTSQTVGSQQLTIGLNGIPGMRIIENLRVTNLSATANAGGIRLLGNDSGGVRDCNVQAHVGIAIGGAAPDGTAFSTSVSNCGVNSLSGTPEAGSIGVLVGPEAGVYLSSVVGFDNNIRAYGAGNVIQNNRIEVGNTGIMLGKDAASATFPSKGTLIAGNTLEGNNDGIAAWSLTEALIAGNEVTFGTNNPGGGGSNTGFRWNSGGNVKVIGGTFNGAWNVGGVYLEGVVGGQLTFDTMSTSSFATSGGTVTYENISVQNAAGFPQMSSTIAKILTATNLTIGQPYLINNANAAVGSRTYDAIATAGAGGFARVCWDGANLRYC